MALAGLVMGADGAIGSTYNVQPRLNCSLHAAFHSGDIQRAMELQDRLNVVIAELIRVCDCRSRGTNIIAGLKAVYRRRGINVGPVRSGAATELTVEQEEGLMAFLAALGWEAE
jgi:N-acetylneuraminate lyase